jgi:primosomal protein DnaI
MEEHPELPPEVYRRSFSLLHQFVQERNHCARCPGLEQCPNMEKGHYPILREYAGYLELSMHECGKLRAFREDQQRKSLIRCHHIPKEIQSASFADMELDNGRTEAIDAAIDFCQHLAEGKRVKGLYLYGSFGVGKSYIAGAITNYLADVGISSIMVHVPALCEELKDAIRTGQVSDKIVALKTAPVLILDDIGAEPLTPWIRDEVYGVIFQYRMTQQLPTVYTSNLDLNELEEHFSHTDKGGKETLKGKRLMERIRPFVRPVPVEGINRRYLPSS